MKPSNGIALVCLLSLTACGGSGSTNPPLPKTSAVPRATDAPPIGSARGRVQFIIAVGGIASQASRRTAGRHRDTASSGSQGVMVTAYAVDDVAKKTPLASVTADISPGSTACGESIGSARTCEVTFDAAAERLNFGIAIYDTAPVNSVIPASAKVLGMGSVENESVLAGQTQIVNAVISGSIASIAGVPSFVSLPADGASHVLPILLTAVDFAHATIGAGQGDPYSNPPTLTLAEFGGSGHGHLMLNGNNAGLTTTVTHSTDAISVVYDGGGTAGYNMQLSVSAAGVTTRMAQISPLVIDGAVNGTVEFTGTFQTRTINATEVGMPASRAIGLLNVGDCGSILGAGAPSSPYVLTSLAFGSCQSAMSDGYSRIPLAIIIHEAPKVPLASTISEFPIPFDQSQPQGITTSNGRIVFGNAAGVNYNGTDNTGNSYLATISSQGVFTTLANIGFYFFGYRYQPVPLRLTHTSDGSVWFPTIDSGSYAASSFCGTTTIDRVTASGTLTTFPFVPISPSGCYYTSNAEVSDIVVGADGNLYFPYGAGIQQMSPDGRFLKAFSTTGTFDDITAITKGPDNAIWFIGRLQATPSVARLDTATGALTVYPDPTGQALYVASNGRDLFVSGEFSPTGNGDIDPGSQTIARMSPSGVVEQRYHLDAGVPGAMVADATGNLWFGECGSQRIGRIDQNGVLAEKRLPSADGFGTLGPSLPFAYGNVYKCEIWQQLVVGPDAKVWFTEYNSGKIGFVTPN